VRRSHVHHNGGVGFGGSGDDILVEQSESSYNGAIYDPHWESGGSKWAFTRNLVVRGNFSHHNSGPGLWTDIDNYFALYEDNLVEDNEQSGIFHEISFDAVIRNNTSRRNGTAREFPGWATGAGIEVNGSTNVEIYGNTLVDNWQGITGVEDHRVTRVGGGGWALKNLYVHHNTITTSASLRGGGRSGIAETAGQQTAFLESANNRYDFNTYYLGAAERYFFWLGADRDEHQWRSYGHDVNGTMQRMR
ncbi:MAG: right-handed parallel beta-helix repeat-containing protein, partial [Acidobacteria bacterium]|nr:right-handed parallel beta-helix repeat-containing protein [Acidobacteriota bacterium]